MSSSIALRFRSLDRSDAVIAAFRFDSSAEEVKAHAATLMSTKDRYAVAAVVLVCGERLLWRHTLVPRSPIPRVSITHC
jgi:hypothetical protein